VIGKVSSVCHALNYAQFTRAPISRIVTLYQYSRFLVVHSMTTVRLLSRSERQYILEGVRENIRADGRECDAVGYFSLKTGVVSNTNGSAKIDRVWHIIGCNEVK